MAKPVTDRPAYIMMKYLYNFFMTNLYFILCNLLFFIVFYLADFVFENILLFYITLIPMGPAITAVLSTMGKLVREKDIQVTRDFFKAYTLNFWPTMKYWFIQLTILLILAIDIGYSTNHSNIFSPVFFILMIVCVFIMIYAFPIISRFEVKLKNLFIVSIYSNFKYFKATLLNITSIGAFVIIYWNFPSISFLFSISLIGYFVMLNLQQPLKDLEMKMSKG
ncbi:YesL family protein [Lederbergia galactosidilytica]|uniref:DUF624 domain-containing protein n=1 Tax=Lederbergia galactosidilytica TaxID=217031 RepID=A0A0Q9XTQ8_9BACI|nr:DUF624 domain-containing protein [Lederbergia galactosidilytica]KRG08894.1 hypothetical protein ACA30_22300 [Virgibacillus soli]KRG11948.1 hypothetical protein ACA29_12540 [Lederbergia galactosidilytica]OAK68408.1 hypothetical protein ABB05_15060 [Lederbergia galactosidilytica]